MTKATDAGELPVTGDRASQGGGFFGALGRFIVRNPWKVIGAWITTSCS